MTHQEVQQVKLHRRECHLTFWCSGRECLAIQVEIVDDDRVARLAFQGLRPLSRPIGFWTERGRHFERADFPNEGGEG